MTDQRPIDDATHRRLAVDLFNQTWELLDRPDRTPAEDEEMIHTAHASRYHWGRVGTPLHFARGEWQLARVYAVLGRAEPALVHARRSLALCEEHGFGDFDLAFAYEALARAHAIAGRTAERDGYLRLAHEAGAHIAAEDDRAIFVAELGTIPGAARV